ncbi:MAG: glycosyltransferase family 4 protein [Fibrobacteres bacterium]|nr:glycosyltransferase family 4 protein [Fibrobacterota bacterium]
MRLVQCLAAYGPAGHEYVLFSATLKPLPFEVANPKWKVIALSRASLFPRLGIEAALMYLAKLGFIRRLPVLPRYRAVDREKIDLMLYVKPSIQSFLWPYRSVFPVHDLQHLWQREFPEVSAGGEWSRREYMYRNAVPAAAAILADSDTGVEDVLRAYGPPRARVHALQHLAPTHFLPPVTPADLERTQAAYRLPPEYLFYGAVFWPHKNHARLLKAMRLLKDQKGFSVPLLLAGGPRFEYERLAALKDELGLGDQVRFLGYVPDEDMYPLYRQALALVMPTFFGPSNIPFLEAWANDCPVLTSNVPGLPEQVGDAGLVFDPRSEQSIADAIWKLYTDAEARGRMIASGRAKVAAWTPKEYAARLSGILDAAYRAAP